MDPSGLETTNKTITWGDEYARNLVEAKTYSYRCSFCRRGFSNAQALGGHMNIHRKDRAKLREFSDENLLSLDITKNSHEDNPPGNSSAMETKNQDNIVKDNLMLRLPLFAEVSSVSDDDDDHEKGERFSSFEKRRMDLISPGGVDLELRLGFEPSVANTD